MPIRTQVERVRRAARKLLALGPAGWWLLVRVQFQLLRAKATIRGKPQGELFETLSKSRKDVGEIDSGDRARVEEVGLAIDRIARLGLFRPRCLARSIAYQRILQQEGIPGSRIRVGVRMKDSAFEAHAWVEWGDLVVGEDPEYVARFGPLTDATPTSFPLNFQRTRPDDHRN